MDKKPTAKEQDDFDARMRMYREQRRDIQEDKGRKVVELIRDAIKHPCRDTFIDLADFLDGISQNNIDEHYDQYHRGF